MNLNAFFFAGQQNVTFYFLVLILVRLTDGYRTHKFGTVSTFDIFRVLQGGQMLVGKGLVDQITGG